MATTSSRLVVELREKYEARLKQLKPADPAELKPLSLFAGVPEKARDKVIEKVSKFMAFTEFDKGELILRQGAYNDSAYFIVEGEVEVNMQPAAEKPVVRGASPAGASAAASRERARMVARGLGRHGTIMLDGPPVRTGGPLPLGPGEIFGEMSALNRFVVSASITARTRVKLLRIQSRGLKTLMQTSKEFKKTLDDRYRQRALESHLRQVAFFAGVDDGFISKLRDRVELVAFESGQVIAEEGAPADAFYLVRAGYVKVAVRLGSSDLSLTYLRKGDCAGEEGLMLDQKWPFSLQALESVELVKIPKAEFRELLSLYPAIHDQFWEMTLERLKARGAVTREPTASEYTQMAMESGLIHGESVLLIDLSTCTQCDECVRGCASTHGGTPRFVREGERFRNWLIPTSCYQCTDPVCMIDCPTGAITRETDTLVVTINASDHATRPCIGCGNCAQRCPWSNIVMVEVGTRADGKAAEQATKCDLCSARPQGPACVQMCPQGSAVRVSFRELEQVRSVLKG